MDSDHSENYWLTEQTIEEEMPAESLLQKHPYGFANYHSGLWSNFEVGSHNVYKLCNVALLMNNFESFSQEELGQVAQIRNPDDVSQPERKRLRLEAEVKNFSDDQYLYDLMVNADIEDVVNFKINKDDFRNLTSADKERMIKFRSREFKLEPKWQKRAQLGLFDIMFAYVYDLKVTEGKHCVESCWNVARLSSTLSWFDVSNLGCHQLPILYCA